MPERAVVRVAAVQIAPDLDTPGGTVSKVLAALAEAAEKGARLVVFPETFVPWYPYFSFVHPPVLTGAEHIRLYENAVVVPGPVTEAVASAAKRLGVVVVLGVNERDHGTLYNAQLVFDADGRLLLRRRKLTPTFHERMIWGQCRRARLLGALQSAGALCPDGAARGDPRRAIPGVAGRADLRRADRGDDPPPCARVRVLRGQRHRLADGSADRKNRSRGEAAPGPDRRLHDGDHLAGRQPRGAAAHHRRRHPGCRPRHGSHRQTQAHDGFGRALRPAGTAQARPRQPLGSSDGDRVGAKLRFPGRDWDHTP